MALMPRRVKYRKYHLRKLKGIATRGNRVSFGDYGLMSLEHGFLSAQQIEAGRISAQRFLSNVGKVYVRVFPHKPVTKKPQETGMGGGKGDPAYYAAVIRPGTIIYEIGGVPEDMARRCFNLLSHKLSVKTKMVLRHLI
jgi:large subunit ribosomal protein L16